MTVPAPDLRQQLPALMFNAVAPALGGFFVPLSRRKAVADALLGIVQPELDHLREQLAAVRAYADDLYTAPQRVSACGVRERLLDILTPTGPARTIAEAMAGRPAPACGDQLTDWTCTLPPGPHPDWRHGNGEHWWTQTRCPGDCGQPNIEHHCTKET